MNLLHTYSDERGSLTVCENMKDIPFDIKRVYWIYDVPKEKERGGHANKISYQFLVAIKGQVDIVLENKEGRKVYHLNEPDKGLLIPPMTWNELLNFSDDAVLLVLSSQFYQPEMYINSKEEFYSFL